MIGTERPPPRLQRTGVQGSTSPSGHKKQGLAELAKDGAIAKVVRAIRGKR